jgi:hypothetical protein
VRLCVRVCACAFVRARSAGDSYSFFSTSCTAGRRAGADPNHKAMKIRVLTSLAAYYLRLASECGTGKEEEEKAADWAEKAEALHNKADRVSMTDQSNLVGKSFLYFTKGQIPKADEMFGYILNKSVGGERNVPALLGKACCDFAKGRSVVAPLHQSATLAFSA